jgi:mannose-6-phosphate isomerase-like protein (cupin superfamily)
MTEEIITSKNEGIDTLEKFILDELPPALEKLTHTFTPGLYSRKWEADAGTIWVTRIHKTEHQFVVLKGSVIVWVDGEEVLIEAGHHGITMPGTRRTLYVLEDVVWMTFHTNPDNLNEDEIVDFITEKHDNQFFSKEDEEKLLKIRSNIEKKYITN